MMAAISLQATGFSGRILASSSRTSPRPSAASLHSPSAEGDSSPFRLLQKMSPRPEVLRENRQVAAKGGGHHASGASSIEDGLVVDLAYLKGVEFGRTSMQLPVAGSCVWADKYWRLDEHSLVCVGGGVHYFGVSGHMTRGWSTCVLQRAISSDIPSVRMWTSHSEVWHGSVALRSLRRSDMTDPPTHAKTSSLPLSSWRMAV
ncbi:hypothetical protein B0J12DRAFT_157553 [Macrophomina phaseolina]|uniref:FAD linked oxidase N-terminal domain-containing protein n=1 Tax=Macrophomina phaseolina TaxID=35725 RepID=A0ABQ8GU55_9PEZI|nr:hypothetical protein B0J12DRAFT_157553 [Macrophomina phaseolina]